MWPIVLGGPINMPNALFNRRSRVRAVVTRGSTGWSVKIRRVRFTRCVFRYGPWDGMACGQVRASAHFESGTRRALVEGEICLDCHVG